MINKKKYNWKELHNELENDIMYLIKKHSKFYRKSIIKSRFDTIIHKDKKSILRDLIGNV